MKTKIFILSFIAVTILLCVSCRKKEEAKNVTATNGVVSNEKKTDDEIEFMLDSIIQSREGKKSKNEIRFGDWTDKDWYDNDYFRFLRKCFDDCYKGIENENTDDLQEYKSLLHNQFFIYSAEEYIGGGMFIVLGFLNKPATLYETVVYSDVDEEKETVTGYSLGGFRKSEETLEVTKKEILEISKEHPEYKLW